MLFLFYNVYKGKCSHLKDIIYLIFQIKIIVTERIEKKMALISKIWTLLQKVIITPPPKKNLLKNIISNSVADGENKLSIIKTSCVKSNEMHSEYKNITNTLHTFQVLDISPAHFDLNFSMRFFHKKHFQKSTRFLIN